jgi:replication factor A1
VQFHYALVDDLLTKEEFERRVEEKIQACGDLIDEPTAAMVVVSELGRHHVKVSALSAKSSLFSFFCKVISKRPPKEFERSDGEKGCVAGLLAGDETGTVQLVLWDDRAMSVEEIEPGDVLEIIGRHAGKSTRDIHVMALRKAECAIQCNVSPVSDESVETQSVDLRVRLIAFDAPRTFTRRDGTTGQMVEAVIGDETGTARLVSWAPDQLLTCVAGSCIRISGARPGRGAQSREYIIDENSSLTPCDEAVTVPFTPLCDIKPEGMYSIRGMVARRFLLRSFITKGGTSSWVRNLIIADEDHEIRLVLWGERALMQLLPGDRIEVYNAPARTGRHGNVEVHAGRGSAVVLRKSIETEIEFTGTLLRTSDGTFIDNSTERYLVSAELPHGQEVRITGRMTQNRIIPRTIDSFVLIPEEVMARVKGFKQSLHAGCHDERREGMTGGQQ